MTPPLTSDADEWAVYADWLRSKLGGDAGPLLARLSEEYIIASATARAVRKGIRACWVHRSGSALRLPIGVGVDDCGPYLQVDAREARQHACVRPMVTEAGWERVIMARDPDARQFALDWSIERFIGDAAKALGSAEMYDTETEPHLHRARFA